MAQDRETLTIATRALDRVLLWRWFVVPNWDSRIFHIAYWDRFGHPENMPKYGAAAFPTVWWWDKDRAAKVPQRS
jgi:microcin C transport system substrate-binding protein